VTNAVVLGEQPHRPRLATVWLDGCSGCHMSLLDTDARLIDLASRCNVVYGPLVDTKQVPQDIDLTLVEGAVSSDHDWHLLVELRASSKLLVAFGDCAVTGNVPRLLDRVLPIHQVVSVDLYLPGCPPPADAIFQVLSDVLSGQKPEPLKLTRFGA
jgi:NAD-reducing hydrogenase small subunit